MATYVLATNHVDTSAQLCDYLIDRVSRSDEVHAVNSLPGGDETNSQDVRDGEESLNVVSSRLAGVTSVETHQFVRGNDPYTDVLEHAEEVDADEIVIGMRKRNPTAKVVFGSTTQRTLLHSNQPVAVVPLVEV
ncbi:universal stress protein [Halobellus clavatus]|jgi:nucleotide-binding universal stress UspA family protein|uniref:Nucleotide-binding universal stress protein, UspA family n=1 Tax=Halobellus clavatus TaxID=660517 RepID=A0A1H3GPQ9_9EURY|nr:universal stress protein [Halobellus clavatus]SDY04618.1 Nucleotide-binding universal stress protein, UspA family [Halobellus clavatus]